MNYPLFSDEYFMNEALKEARQAFDNDEVPVGAVVVSNNQVVGKGRNMSEALNDITAHAEIIAITAAEVFFDTKFLEECILYVTVEPCLMCAGAIQLSRISRLVFGAAEPKTGFSRLNKELIFPKLEITQGILEEHCKSLMQDFFRKKRKG